MSAYEMIVLDLDGTLTNSEKKITKKTKESLMRAQRMGKKVVLASGRPTAGIMALAEELRLEEYGGYILAFNGGHIIEMKTGTAIYDKVIPPEYAGKIYEYVKDTGLCIMTYTDSEIVIGMTPNEYAEKESRINKIPFRQTDRFAEVVDFSVNKFLLAGEPEQIEQMQSTLRDKYGWKMNIFRSEPFFLEIMPQSIDKAYSLGVLLEKMGYTREQMICCGDGYNDRSMIQFAGLGVAMANGQKEVREAADYVTKRDNDQDGIAEVVEKFLLNETVSWTE